MSTYMTLLPRRVQTGSKADNVLVNTLEMRPADRTDQDIEIVTSKLKKLNVLQEYPENVVEEIGRHATIKSFAANRPVIVPDAVVTHIYIILTGSVAVTVIDQTDESKFVSLCTLTVGCSFGETCVFGQCRYKDVMCTTCEDTDVMCVEGELVKKLFMSHDSELDRSLLASNPCADDGPNVSAAIRTLWQIVCFHFGDHLRDHPVGSLVYSACSSGRELVDWLLSYQRSPLWTRQQITMIGQVLLNEGFLKQVVGEPVFQDASSAHYQYLVSNPSSPFPHGLVFPPPQPSPSARHSFLFPEDPSPIDSDLPSPISPEALPSLLDQCINTIIQHSSDVLATNVSLRKSSFHRTKDDLELIVEDMKYMKGFMYLPESAQEKLARYVYILNYPKAASYICHQGEDVKSWYTIVKGSVNVLRDNEVICTLHLYDNFGKEMIENDLKWPATFQLRQNFGIVLCVDKKDLQAMNSELKANTITEDGWEVVVEKKASPDQQRRSYSIGTHDSVDGTKSNRTLHRTKSRVTLRGRLCSVKKASPNKIVDRLVQSDLDQGDVTTIFAEDFFLTYLSFMTTDELCSKLLDKYILSDELLMRDGGGEGAGGTEEKSKRFLSVPNGHVTPSNGHEAIDASSRKRNIAKHVAVWIRAGGSILLSDPIFKQFLTQLQHRLAKDELLSEQEILRQASTAATQASSTWLESASRLDVRPETPSKDTYQFLGADFLALKQSPGVSPRQSPMASPILKRGVQSPPVVESPTLRRREKDSFMQTMKIALRGRSEDSPLSLGFSLFPPFSPQDKDEISIHLNRKEAVSLSIHMEDTARVILNKVSQNFKLDPSHHDLCELDSAGVKVVMKLQTASVHTKMSVNGRLFVLPTSAPLKLPELVLPEQIVGPNKPFPINEQSRDIAAHLTLYDWNLFMNIPQMEFIYQAFELYKVGKVTTNLDIMTRRFNEIHAWVITEVCRTPEIQKRTRLIQKFIKIAGHCLNFKNLNSFLAIVLALDNITITRMKKVWKEVHAGLIEQLEYFKTFTNTSSNFKQLRDFQRMQESPVIPYLPMMLKDGFFIHQHNETFVKGSVNFEKMHMMANMVRSICQLKTGTLSRDIYQVVSRNQALQGYIRSLKVIDNQKLQMDMSYLIEPKFHSSP